MIEPAAVARRDAGVQFQLTMGVDDVDAMCAELTGPRRWLLVERSDGTGPGESEPQLHDPGGPGGRSRKYDDLITTLAWASIQE